MLLGPCNAFSIDRCLDFNHCKNFLIDHAVMQREADLSTELVTVIVVKFRRSSGGML